MPVRCAFEAAVVKGMMIVAVGAVTACADDPPPRSQGPAPLPPVSCSEYPAGRQVALTCRYLHDSQYPEVWQRSIVQGSRIAVALGRSHIQFLSVDKRVQRVTDSTPVECKRESHNTVNCIGGRYQRPVAFIATTQFAFLTPEEAQARSSDPLVPQERRPLDARYYAQAQ